MVFLDLHFIISNLTEQWDEKVVIKENYTINQKPSFEPKNPHITLNSTFNQKFQI
jgi:hypothetical protein